MGLGMMNPTANAETRSPVSTWLLYGLHIVLGLTLPVLLALVIGCVKIEEEQTDYGPEVDGNAIDLALSKAVNGASTSATAVGQRLNYVITRRLENEEATQLLAMTSVEVIDRIEDASGVKFMLRISQSERLNANGEFETKITEEPLFPDPAVSLAESANRAESAMGRARALSDVRASRKVTRVTYHKLREFTQSVPAPKAVRERTGCGGLSPCELTINYIQFDMVQWFDDGGAQKVSFDFGFTTQTPFLPFGKDFDRLSGLLVLDCRSTYVPIEGRTVYVRDCQNLEDFQK
jgi:hypothetical protein